MKMNKESSNVMRIHEEDNHNSNQYKQQEQTIEKIMKHVETKFVEFDKKFLQKQNEIQKISLEKYSKEIECQFKKNEEEQQVDVKLKNFRNDIENLLMHKVNISDYENVISSKVDNDMMNSKVSLDYFEATKRDLTNNMLEIITQVTERELDWQKSLTEMNKLMESKLNKDEIPPFKEYLNEKVESIQDRLKSLNSLKKDAEAAGAKYQVMKGVKCISCDNNAVMKVIEEFSIPKQKPLLLSLPHRHFIDKLNQQMKIEKKSALTRRANTTSVHQRSFKPILNKGRAKSSSQLTKIPQGSDEK